MARKIMRGDNMKKAIVVLLIIFLTVFILTACDSPTDELASEPEKKIEDVITPEDKEDGELIDETEDREQDKLAETENDRDNLASENIEDDRSDRDSSVVMEDQQIAYLSPFTGQPIEEIKRERAIMASIENTQPARPQSGLEDADIVYEFLVEGGITRFLALYWGKIPDKIGPVRSVRPYLIRTSQDYHALLLHAGASPAGFALLQQENVLHLDQIYNGSYYWRSSDRKAPHNLYTGGDIVKPYLRNITGQKYTSRFNFQNVSLINPAQIKANIIRINYWGDNRLLYKYNEDRNIYLRYYSKYNIPHMTDTGGRLKTRNIIVQYVKTKVIDEQGRLEMELEGRNKALVFKDGIVISGYWEKNNDEWARYYNETGNEIELNPGKTWIEVVPLSCRVEYEE
ncbi:DUF3048 domain-containing protein [Iocasia frigidifontis]|uniref:DUF3048 domain-containing protein n=2 Tax=Iocasia fonsfrigidae TaxID=2682810 RepID=A0A8A7KCZ7_9FIRM|nr:DUF3048 domain-containing protein [Iocasia fonsfrigidae]